MFKSKRKLNKMIEDLRVENTLLKTRIDYYVKDMTILLENAGKDRAKIKDLEANIEFLKDNLSAKKKKDLGL